MLEWTVNGRLFYGSIVYNMARRRLGFAGLRRQCRRAAGGSVRRSRRRREATARRRTYSSTVYCISKCDTTGDMGADCGGPGDGTKGVYSLPSGSPSRSSICRVK